PGKDENAWCGPVKSSCVTPGNRAKTMTGFWMFMAALLCSIEAAILPGIGSGRKSQFPSFKDMTRTIAILVFPDFQLLDAAGPITAFEAGGRETAPPAYRLRVIARAAGPVTSSSGVQLVAEAFPEGPLDTLIVAGGWG